MTESLDPKLLHCFAILKWAPSPKRRKRKPRKPSNKSHGKNKAGTLSDLEDLSYSESETENETDIDENAKISLEEVQFYH